MKLSQIWKIYKVTGIPRGGRNLPPHFFEQFYGWRVYFLKGTVVAKKSNKKGSTNAGTEDFTVDLISSLNREHGTRVAYNLAYDESPTHVKRWISTGSRQLDYIIANQS